MKSIKIILIIILLIMGISMIGGLIYGITNHSKEEGKMETGFTLKTKLANRKTYSTDELNKIKVSYKFEEIQIYESDTDEVILEEYMNRWDESMLATTTQKDGILSISSGERDLINILNPFRVKIKLYLPSAYHGTLDIRCSSGSIKTDIDLTVAELKLQASSGSIQMKEAAITGDVHVQCSSGSIKFDQITTEGDLYASTSSGSINIGSAKAKNIQGKATSGSIKFQGAQADTITSNNSSGSQRFEDIKGDMDITTTSGSIHIYGQGSGSFTSNSGSLNLELNKVTGDIKGKTTSGSVKLTIPEDLSFYFKANTSSGSIRTGFDDNLSFNKRGNTAEGTIGKNPDHTINLTASSGSIKIIN